MKVNGRLQSIITMVNKEFKLILQIRILHEEKHGSTSWVDDEISLSSDENNRARSPPRCDVYLLESNNVIPSGVSWEARAESLC